MGQNNNFETLFSDYFAACNNSYQNRDNTAFDIALRKQQYEENLDAMWRNVVYNTELIIEYNKQVGMIKSAGFRVYRNSEGKHKIVRRN